MRYRVVSGATERTLIAVFDSGEEALAGLQDVAEGEGLSAASITAVGAVQAATLGWYDLAEKDYRRIEIDEQAEVVSLVGDVALDPEGAPAVHAHAVLGLRDGSTRGGHLLAAVVRPTLEVVLRETPAELAKTYRPEVGLALIDLDAGHTPQS